MNNRENSLTLIVPCFNEYESLPGLITKCRAYSAQSKINFIIVNNGSTDLSFQYLKSVRDQSFKIVHIENNLGYGHGISTGIKHSNTNHTGWFHADQLEVLDELLPCLETGLEKESFYKGKRKQRAPLEKILSGLYSIIASLILRIVVRDINSQPNIFPTSFLREFDEAPNDFSFELFYLYAARKNSMNEVRFNVSNHVRKFGHSSWNYNFFSKILLGKSLIFSAIKLRRHLF